MNDDEEEGSVSMSTQSQIQNPTNRVTQKKPSTITSSSATSSNSSLDQTLYKIRTRGQ